MANAFISPDAQQDPIAMLRAACAAAGTQQAWAKANDLSPQYVCDVLLGRREPGESVLAALGLRKVVTYLLTQEEWARRDRAEAHRAMGGIFARIAEREGRPGSTAAMPRETPNR